MVIAHFPTGMHIQASIYIYTFNTLNLAGHFYIVVDTTTWGVKCIEPYLG